MKLTKRLFTAGVALALTLSLNVPAFAATITVNNPAAGETYTAYKLFDVTHGAGPNGTMGDDDDTYSYSTTEQEIATALQGANLGLTFTKAADADIWYVSGLDDKTDAAALAAYIASNDTLKTKLGKGIEAELDEISGKTVINTGNETGYYFVDSSLGSLCALNTAEDKATINEKNSVPSITKKVKEDSNGAWQETATIDVTDTIEYQLTVNVADAVGLGTGIDADFVITDVLPDGTRCNTDSVAISGWEEDTDYTVNYVEESRTLTITLLKDGKLSDQDEGSDIKIEYDATVTDKTKITNGIGSNLNGNHVTLTYHAQKSEDYAYVNTFTIGQDAEGNSTITKVDGSDEKVKLSGVEFVLQNNATKKYATFDENDNLTGWIDSQEDATRLVTDNNGNIVAHGLDADTYTLTETYTLPGYNLLADTITVVVAENGSVTYKLTNSQDEADNHIDIVNVAGSLLPSTGGMGTTVLYIAGVALALGAGITLVVRRRMNSDR